MLAYQKGWLLMRLAGAYGFTLIELLVTIAIAAILATIAVPEFRAFLMNTQIKTAAEAINNGLQLAKGEAVRRNAKVRFILGAGTSWTVGCEAPSATCPQIIQSRASAEGSSTAIVTTLPAGATAITYNGLGRVLSLNGDGTAPITRFNVDVPESVLAAASSKNLSILTTGGSIRMCDPNNTTAGDPRAC